MCRGADAALLAADDRGRKVPEQKILVQNADRLHDSDSATGDTLASCGATCRDRQ
jgi:hypothetical protein